MNTKRKKKPFIETTVWGAQLVFVLTLILLGACNDNEQQESAQALHHCNETLVGQQVKITAGQFSMGDARYYEEETPIHTVSVDEFWIDRTEVTNKQFEQFVMQTGYVTRAEKGFDVKSFPELPPELLVPGSMVFVPPDLEQGTTGTWWKFVEGANWRHPYGPQSTLEGKESYPVVQVTIDDAVAYAQWAGRRLPTENEWEYAALGGDKTKDKPEFTEANYWQGVFPLVNTEEDGFKGMAPVGCFSGNNHGLYDMVGNVWELTASVFYPNHDKKKYQAIYPNGLDHNQPNIPVQVIKGGSYLCARNYCQRYRPASRQAQDAFLASSHVGFRTVL